MLEEPLITVGITCFNAGDTIRRAIDSAFAQTWPRKEVVVVDDGSSDRSLELIREIASRNPEISVVRHSTNLGYPAALNSLLRRAKGEFIAIFDDDDVSFPERLAEQWRRIVEYESRTGAELVLCYTNRDVMTGEGTEPAAIARAIGRRPTEPFGPRVADFILLGHGEANFTWGMFGSCTLMARASVFRAVGDFDVVFRRGTEWDFAVRASFAGAHFIAVDKSLIEQHKTSTADKAGSKPLEYVLLLCYKYKSYLKKKHAYQAAKALVHSRFFNNKGMKWKGLGFRFVSYALSPPLAALKVRERLLRKSK